MSILSHHFIILLLSLSSAVIANHVNARKDTKEDDQSGILVQQKRQQQRQQHRQQQSTMMMKCKRKNEQYTECASSTCFEESCGEDVLFAKPIHKMCTEDCKRGCQCKPGFYRNHDGRCVDELSCIMCGYGEDWAMMTMGVNEKNSSSSSSSSSKSSVIEEKTCDDVVGMEIEPDTTSIDNRTSNNNNEPFEHGGNDEGNGTGGRCVCGEGFYRTDDGLCVTEQTCRLCTEKKNEIFQPCGSSSCWEYKCDDVSIPLRQRVMRVCTADCVSGCKCHLGFYRNTQTGECVSAESCRGANKK